MKSIALTLAVLFGTLTLAQAADQNTEKAEIVVEEEIPAAIQDEKSPAQ